MTVPTLLEVKGLSVHIGEGSSSVQALSDVDLRVGRGEVVGLVGESGGGKSMMARAIVAMLPRATTATGQVIFDGHDVLTMDDRALRVHRGGGAAMCFQNPRAALAPVRSVGEQLIDRLRVHRGLDVRAAADAALELFRSVGIRDAPARLEAYPHELSGGMCQRVMIALALACEPQLLLADEPTTGLDVTLTEDILKLFRADADDHQRGVLLISHDLASVARVCDRLVVLYAGTVAEEGSTAAIVRSPAHHYTAALLRSVPDIQGEPVVPTPGTMPLLRSGPHACPFAPRCDHADEACTATRPRLQPVGSDGLAACVHPLAAADGTAPHRLAPRSSVPVPLAGTGTPGPPAVEVRDAHVVYRSRFGGGGHHALHGVNLRVDPGQTVGVVGESGCGKSTLARLIMGLVPATSGSVRLDGTDLAHRSGRELRRLRARAQMVFQDPVGALSPRRTVRQAIAEPMDAAGVQVADRDRRLESVLERVGLGLSMADRRPHELSGGQAQRVGIARALAVDPHLVVFDEPTSALDVTVQAQILDLAAELASDGQRAYVFISHDLATVRTVCDRVVVLYLGHVVEEGTTREIFEDPRHPYTRALLSSAPSLRGPPLVRHLELGRDLGEAGEATGCPLAPRCPWATGECEVDPPLEHGSTGRAVACWHTDPHTHATAADQAVDPHRLKS